MKGDQRYTLTLDAADMAAIVGALSCMAMSGLDGCEVSKVCAFEVDFQLKEQGLDARAEIKKQGALHNARRGRR